MKKFFTMILCLIVSGIFVCSAFAAEDEQSPIYFEGENTGLQAELFLGQTAYVPLRAICELAGASGISWSEAAQTATVEYDGYAVTAKCGQNYIIANGRYLFAPYGVMMKGDRVIVPVRVIAKAMGLTVRWEPQDRSIRLERGEKLASGDSFYNETDLYWMSRIIYAESGAESMNAKLAVGAVVMHRVESSIFPGTVKGVIFDNKYGVQFTPTVNGAIYKTPSESCIIAAKLCLDGADIVPGALYFATTGMPCWASRNRKTAMILGKQQFYY